MMTENRTSIPLRKAISEGRIKQFIAEHDGETGDADALEGVIRSMAGTSKATPATSLPDDSGD
jgi:hypothetical protein